MRSMRSAATRRPRWLLAHSNLANALLSAGEARAAVEASDRWLELAPGNIEALSIKALALYEAGEREAGACLLDFSLTHPTLHVPAAADPHYHHPALAITKTSFGPSDGPVADFEAIVRQAV